MPRMKSYKLYDVCVSLLLDNLPHRADVYAINEDEEQAKETALKFVRKQNPRAEELQVIAIREVNPYEWDLWKVE